MQLTFTSMCESHLTDAVRLSAAEQWPHRIEDWALVLNLGHGVVALADNKPVATALVTPLGAVAMANLIIVDASARRRGVGRRVVEAAMATAEPDSWQLVATPDGLPLYEKLGFHTVGEISQHQGVAARIAAIGNAVWARSDDLAAIIQLDRAALQMDRANLYHALAARARFALLREDNDICGFAAVHEFGRGRVIGPVVARNIYDAKSLMSLVISEYGGQFLRVDTETGLGLGDWLNQCGLMLCANGYEMRTAGHAPGNSLKRYALATQALG